MRHKGKVLEIGRRKKRGSQKGKERVHGGEGAGKMGGLDNVILPSQETAQTISKNEPSGAEEGTAQGRAINRQWMRGGVVEISK